jgi:hypothetical protein
MKAWKNGGVDRSAILDLGTAKDTPVSIRYEGMCILGLVWTLWSKEIAFPCDEWNSGRPVHSPSIYRLSYSCSLQKHTLN